MSELPEGWESVEIGALTFPSRPRCTPSDFPQLPFIGMEQVEAQTRKLLGTVPAATMKSTAFRFIKDDVLYGRLRPYLNKVYCAEFEGLCSSEFIVLPSSSALSSKYLHYYLNTESFVAFANQLNQGDRPRVSFDQIAFHQLPLPPLNEQRRIVAKLEKLLSHVDTAQARLATIPRILKRFRQAVLAVACSGQLTAYWRSRYNNLSSVMAAYKEGLQYRRHQFEISPDVDELPDLPSNWHYVPIGNVSDFQQGMQIAKSTRLKEGGVNRLPILRTVNYSNAFSEDVEYIELDEQSLIAEADDVILARTGTIGKVLIGYRGVFHNNTFRLNYDKELLLNKYLVYWLESHFVQSYVSRNAGRSAQPDLTHKAFAPCPLPLPPVKEQQEIVRRVEALFQTADALEARHLKAKTYVDKLAQSILARAFRGELVTTEAELARQEGRDYEPASVLLERIRQESAQQQESAKPKAKRTSRGKRDDATKKMFA